MATVKIEITGSDGWVAAVVSSAEQVIVENQSTYPISMAYGDSLPAASSPGHILQPGAISLRLVPGTIYLKTSNPNHGLVVISA